ncbi:MAG TPA: flavoprotein [Elusimicrobiota bacterium]|nr:flavoprotein [Elusimicrobiota bacterium]HRY30732.1 flavoprotein [Elusimicrobiota bacterium]
MEIVLCISGSIAAYKSAEIVRCFRRKKADVTCVLTPAARHFVTPLTLSTLTGRPVPQDMFAEPLWNMAHLSLTEKADAILMAPASADLLAKLAHGLADDLPSTLALAASQPVFIAPAMHEGMWLHPATQANVGLCKGYGYRFIGPARGEMASGVVGMGRLEEPALIVDAVLSALKTSRKKR